VFSVVPTVYRCIARLNDISNVIVNFEVSD
jgi:hypothetical protein